MVVRQKTGKVCKKVINFKAIGNSYYWQVLRDIIMSVLYIILLLVTVHICDGSGYFELQLENLQNPQGELFNGNCCDGAKNPDTGVCLNPCDTSLRICLREYQTRALDRENTCAFGNITSQVLGGNSIEYPEGTGPVLKLPFQKTWTVSCYFVINLFHVSFISLTEY